MSTEVLSGLPAARLPQRLVLAKWLGYFMLVDLLFLPYFQLLIMPFSLPIVFGWLVFGGVKLRSNKYLALLFFLSLGVAVSLGISIFDARLAEYQMENLKRAVQLLSTFAYFFFFLWLAREVDLRIQGIAAMFLVWFALLATAFYLDPTGASETIRLFYGRLVTSEETLSLHLRFPYQFTDPNTAAYFFLIAVAPLMTSRRSGLAFAILTAVVVSLLFLTQSKGALMALALMVLLTLYPPDQFMKAIFSVRRTLVLLLLVLIAYFAFVWLTDIFDSNTLLKRAYERIFESQDQIASGGSRFGIWAYFAENFTPLPFGRGFILLIGGISERPHSDFVRMTFSYGVIALVAIVVFLFGRLRSFPAVIIPGLMAFLINSLIDEQKLFALYLSLLAIQLGSEERKRAFNKSPEIINAV
jgi:hypothetical protein